MDDRISIFSDSILCYILSFLPTKEAVATSVLSRRWKLLWRSVPSLDFDHPRRYSDYDKEKEACSRFLLSVYSFLFWRNMEKPLHRLRLRCFSNYNDYMFETCIKVAMRISGRLEHLDLSLHPGIAVPSVVFSCKTLVVLKLANLTLKNIFFVDFPLLKILHLNFVSFSECPELFQQFLSGSTNLEDLEVNNLNANTAEKFNRFPKLVRAKINAHLVPLENVKNVQVLVTDGIYLKDLVFDLQNLVQLELTHVRLSKEWVEVLEVLKHCPKLQTLVIDIYEINLLANGQEGTVLPYPHPVPTCISLHLKTCCLNRFRGSRDEFLFARYIMQNAKYLRTMKICIRYGFYNTQRTEDHMKRELFSCMKSSDCTLSFELHEF